jgi:hypothetical protein
MHCLLYLVLALVLVQVLVQVQVQALVLQQQQQGSTQVRYVHVTTGIVMCCKTACFESLQAGMTNLQTGKTALQKERHDMDSSKD